MKIGKFTIKFTKLINVTLIWLHDTQYYDIHHNGIRKTIKKIVTRYKRLTEYHNPQNQVS
jgi:hypothetical protein